MPLLRRRPHLTARNVVALACPLSSPGSLPPKRVVVHHVGCCQGQAVQARCCATLTATNAARSPLFSPCSPPSSCAMRPPPSVPGLLTLRGAFAPRQRGFLKPFRPPPQNKLECAKVKKHSADLQLRPHRGAIFHYGTFFLAVKVKPCKHGAAQP